MGDPGFISGLIGVGIDRAVAEIVEHIKIALHCKEELKNLEKYVRSIEPINRAIHKYRMGLKMGEIDQTAPSAAVNDWLKRLNKLVGEANDMAQKCSIPTYNFISRYRLSKSIRQMVGDLKEHLDRAALIGITNQLAQNVVIGEGLQRIEDRLQEPSGSSSSVTQPTQRMQPVLEPLIVGQEEVLSTLHKFIFKVEGRGSAYIGVVAMGGAGKTLLLKTALNSEQVQQQFENDLVLWLTVSHNPSTLGLGRDLGRQIAMQINQPFNERFSEEDARRWVQEKMNGRRFLMFLDDVWEGSENLLQMLGVPETDNSKIVISTRDRSVLHKMRVRRTETIDLNCLSETQSWNLFAFHAFAYNNHEIPPGDVGEMAKLVCCECDGLPLAIKVIGATMAGVTDPIEWKVTLERLRNADRLNEDVQAKLYNRLRLSYDALGKCDPILQLCFLYIGAFKEDEDMYVEDVINLWVGEGLLGEKNSGYDPLEIGRTHANSLFRRCLIEASIKDADGQVMVCSMHDVLHDLALQIGEREENCLFRSGKRLEAFPVDDCVGRSRISLMENSFDSIPETFRGPEVLSLMLSENKQLKGIPGSMIESLTSIRVLDLRGTAVSSLPASMGRMKHLVCLRLANMPIQSLPKSITSLKKLEIFDLSNCSKLRQLPSGLNKLVSLRYFDLSFCQGLLSVPRGISGLTSLQYLRMERCWQAWERRPPQNQCEKLKMRVMGETENKSARLDDLRTLKQLKWLGLEEYRDTITHGTLGNMLQMRTLVLRLTKMKALPDDMIKMTDLRIFLLNCRDLIKVPHWVCDLQHLGCLILSDCDNLEELCELQRLRMLRRLDITGCWKLKELPATFGQKGAFPALESFWLEKMMALEELPALAEEAMPLLKRLGVVVCVKVKKLPEGFFNLRNLEQIQLYSSPLVLETMTEGGADWERVQRLERECRVEVVREYGGHKRLKEITARMGNKYWWDRFVKEMWMNFHV